VKVPGLLTIAGGLLLVVQFVFGVALNKALNNAWAVIAPLAGAFLCFTVAIVWAFVRGPAAVRLAAICTFLSLAFLAIAVVIIYLPFGRGIYLGASAAFGILAVTLGISAYRAEVAQRESTPPTPGLRDNPQS
jgi:hypothetical protein